MTQWLIKTFIPEPDAPESRQRYGLLSGGVGILLNLALCCGKFLAGLWSGSIAVTADAVNNLSDAGSSVVTLAGFRMAAKKADEDHPFGHGRMEYLAGLAVSVVILLVGLELGKSSIQKILSPQAVEFSWLTAGILAVSVLVKLWMFRFNRTLGRRIDSAAMQATATDSLSDSAATCVLLLGLLAGHFLDLPLDGWLGVGVSLFILRAGWGAAKDTLDPLLGQSPDPALVAGIQETVLSHAIVSGIHDLVIHDYGPGRRMISLHAEVPMHADMLAVHDEIDNIERELRDRFQVEAVIHMDPIATDDPATNDLRARMAQLVREIDPAMTIHDFRMTAGPDHQNLIFDAVVPHHCALSDEEVRAAIAEKAAELGESYYTVVSLDRAYTEMG